MSCKSCVKVVEKYKANVPGKGACPLSGLWADTSPRSPVSARSAACLYVAPLPSTLRRFPALGATSRFGACLYETVTYFVLAVIVCMRVAQGRGGPGDVLVVAS